MFSRQDIRLDATAPALIVQHGKTLAKYFYLIGRRMILGSARGCDIQLGADEVAPVHCIITRASTGLLVRDCGSRFGTKVNGVTVTESPLNNDDLLQIGPFVFEVSLPRVPNVEDTPVDYTNVSQKRTEDQEASRERLLMLASRLRRRLL
jgi:pSer/pThr/pTyr-binding forkhead associated (FHA) protein